MASHAFFTQDTTSEIRGKEQRRSPASLRRETLQQGYRVQSATTLAPNLGISMLTKPSVVHSSAAPVAFNPNDLLSIEEVARRLHTDVGWVREKCRRRCPNQMPVYNLRRHLVFSWPDVCEWVRRSPRPVHARHVRRRKVAT